MVDESRKVDQARDDRVRDMAKERVKPRPPAEGEFDKILERSKMAQQLGPQQGQQMKTATEQAIREATRQQDRDQERRRDEGEKKEGRDERQKGEQSDGRIADQKVVAKGRLKQDSGGGGGGHEGYSSSGGRRELTRTLARSGVRSVPVDLQGKFAGKLAKAMQQAAAQQAGLTQQVLNKIVQFVRIGINRRGEKEIRIDLSERIFRGLKLRVIARGGKVSVHFRTADPKGRKVFEKNADAIREALEKKGIEVDEIVVS